MGVASASSPVPAVGRAETSPPPSEMAHGEHELHRERETPDEHTDGWIQARQERGRVL